MRDELSPSPAPLLAEETIGGFLGRLAARMPAPGGGASAALHAAQAAALLGMVARYTTGEKYAAHAVTIARVTEATDELCTDALRLAEDDAAAFTAVTDAYRLPKGTPEEKADRSRAIARSLAGAAEPPAAVVDLVLRTIALAEQLLPIGNRNVVTDVAAAAEAARAAAATARINIEINLGGIKDPAARTPLTETVDRADGACTRAEQIAAAVRKEITT